MTPPWRIGAGVAAALLLTAALGALSRVPYRPDGGGAGDARVRLSWRFTPAALPGACPTAGPGEDQDLPVHMRSPGACLEAQGPVHLQVRVDGRTVVDEHMRPGGVRGDRPLYVYHELRVSPGCRDIEVAFTSDALPGAEPRSPPLRLSARIDLDPREVALVTLDRPGGELVLRAATCP